MAVHPDAAVQMIRNSVYAHKLHSVLPDKILLSMDRAEVPGFTAAMVQQGMEIQAIRPRHNLEDYFLKLTGN